MLNNNLINKMNFKVTSVLVERKDFNLNFEEIKELLKNHYLVLEQAFYDERYDFEQRHSLTHKVYRGYVEMELEEEIGKTKRIVFSRELVNSLLNKSFRIKIVKI